jgi:hypothetical protein
MPQQEFSHGVHIRTTAPSEKPSGYTTSQAYDGVVSREIANTDPVKGGGGKTRGTLGRGMNFKLISEILEHEATLPDGFDLAAEIIKALKGDKLDLKTKLLAQLELLQYLQPKMKAVEVKGKVELDDQTVERRLQYLLDKIGAAGGDRPGEANRG